MISTNIRLEDLDSSFRIRLETRAGVGKRQGMVYCRLGYHWGVLRVVAKVGKRGGVTHLHGSCCVEGSR